MIRTLITSERPLRSCQIYTLHDVMEYSVNCFYMFPTDNQYFDITQCLFGKTIWQWFYILKTWASCWPVQQQFMAKWQPLARLLCFFYNRFLMSWNFKGWAKVPRVTYTSSHISPTSTHFLTPSWSSTIVCVTIDHPGNWKFTWKRVWNGRCAFVL